MNRSEHLGLPQAALVRLTATGDQAPEGGSDRDRLAQLAAEFESTLMLEMIKQMRQSLLGDTQEDEGLGASTFRSTIDSELASHLARAGGLGLQQILTDAFDRQHGGVQSPAVSTPGLVTTGVGPQVRRTADAPPTAGVQSTGLRPAVRAASPAASVSAHRSTTVSEPAAADGHGAHLSLDMGARVSSTYGLRRDPFSGRAKFHGGIDLAAPYGRAVPSAAGGTVVTAGEQGGYGLTVVVRHTGGYESRYAHLSSIDVSVGDQIAKGTQVGRVGSTGRSTAPHLHFEVTNAGERVDPERFVRNLTSDIKGQ